jgi:hypothetical protein
VIAGSTYIDDTPRREEEDMADRPIHIADAGVCAPAAAQLSSLVLHEEATISSAGTPRSHLWFNTDKSNKNTIGD